MQLDVEVAVAEDRDVRDAVVGQVEDPARVLRSQFGARFIVVRRQPRGPAEQLLLKRLQGLDFDEVASNAPSFRLFRVRD